MDTLERARAQSAEVLKRLDRQRGYLWLAGSIDDPGKLRALFQAMQRDSEDIRRESEKLQALLNDIRQQRRRQIVKQIGLSAILIVLTFLLIVGMPTVAQDATAETTIESTATPAPAATEQPPVVVIPTEPPGDTQLIDLVKQALPWAGAVAIVALIVVGTLGHQAIVNLGRSAPVPVREVAITSGDSVLKQVEDYVKTTPTQIDDVAAAELRKLFDQWVAEIRENPTTAGTVTATFSRNVPVPEPPQQPGVVG